MTNASAVTVVMPAHDAAATIGAALDSVAAQSQAPASLILIDDGSTDATAAIAGGHARLDIHVIRQANAGPAAARNRGLDATVTDFVAFLDADDVWPPRAIEHLLSGLKTHPGAAVVQGKVRDLWTIGDGFAETGDSRVGFNLGSALWRRSILEALGRFDETLRRGEDVDLWVRLFERGLPRVVIEDETLLYRRRGVNDRDDVRVYCRSLATALKRSLDRTVPR